MKLANPESPVQRRPGVPSPVAMCTGRHIQPTTDPQNDDRGRRAPARRGTTRPPRRSDAPAPARPGYFPAEPIPSFERLRSRNVTLAGFSARRRMKYGYHCVPYGT